jgi:oxygen-independent coproporphyrinogen III oxidase
MPSTIRQLWDNELIRKHDLSGPRYTSYPTAPQFKEGFTQQQWLNAVETSNRSASPLSLYFHIPFCDTVCYYCGCNKIITANKALATPYVDAMMKEIQMQAHHIDTSRPVDQLHWGGGTPTYLSDNQMSLLMREINKHFTLHKDDSGEYGIEIHPQGVTPNRLKHLRQLGFNRLSMGVQDFDEHVQKAVNRFNSVEEVTELVNSARSLGFTSTSVDLIYGLPLQSTVSFGETLERVIDIRPDRISVFNYAHMPELFKTQKQIDARQLPEPQEKLQILYNSIERLLLAGYVYVGMDHFALPSDELAKAQSNKKLHRNFQGYATHGDCELFSFGVSSIASFGSMFIQNVKGVEEYYAAIENQELPTQKGIALSSDDHVRQHVISELICHFEVDFASVSALYGIRFKEHFAPELSSLAELEDDGLLSITAESLRVHSVGRILIRRICMAFDAYLNRSQLKQVRAPKYSRII